MKSLIKNFPIYAIVGLFPLIILGVLYWAITTANRLVPRPPLYGPDQTVVDNAPKHVFQQASHYTQYPLLLADTAKKLQLEEELKKKLPESEYKQLYYVTSFATSHGEAARLPMPLLVRLRRINPEEKSLFMLVDLQNYGKLHYQEISAAGVVHMKCGYPFAEDLALPWGTSMTVDLTPVF